MSTICNAERKGWGCTRKAGHEGHLHVAHTDEGKVAAWWQGKKAIHVVESESEEIPENVRSAEFAGAGTFTPAYRVQSVENFGSIVRANCVEVTQTKQGWRKKPKTSVRRVNFDARMYGHMREDYPEGITGLIVEILGEEFENESIRVVE